MPLAFALSPLCLLFACWILGLCLRLMQHRVVAHRGSETLPFAPCCSTDSSFTHDACAISDAALADLADLCCDCVFPGSKGWKAAPSFCPSLPIHVRFWHLVAIAAPSAEMGLHGSFFRASCVEHSPAGAQQECEPKTFVVSFPLLLHVLLLLAAGASRTYPRRSLAGNLHVRILEYAGPSSALQHLRRKLWTGPLNHCVLCASTFFSLPQDVAPSA